MSFKDPAFSEFLDTIRSRISISDIAASRIKIRRAGREFKACCPFHSEKTPSFTINDQKGFFHCFGCGAHGNVIDFLVRHDNLSFMEAVEQLGKSIGMDVPRRDPKAVETAKQVQTARDCIEVATQIFESSLWTSDGALALKMLTERGIDEPTIRAFRLGYAPANRQSLKLMLRERGFEDEQMIAAGLIKSYEGGQSSAFFSDRLIFPIADRLGRPVAFGARLLQGEGPKYINSPDTDMFHKGELLYGLSRARQAVAGGEALIVVEGYMDVIALVQSGWQGAVAPLGTALTEAQVELLWRMRPDEPPILCFDGDASGNRAAARSVERILPIAGADHRTLRFAFMPEGEDPDSLVRSKGRTRMQAIFDAAIPMDEMLWALEAGGSPPRTPEAEAGLKKRIESRVHEIKDPDLARAYRSALLSRFYDFVRSQKSSGPSKTPRAGHHAATKSAPASGKLAAELRALPSGIDKQIALLFGLVLLHPELLDEFVEPFGALEVHTADLKSLQHSILYCYEATEALDKRALSAHLLDAEVALVAQHLSDACAAQTQCHHWQIDQARLAWQIWHRQLSINLIEDELRRAEAQRWLDSGSFNSSSFGSGSPKLGHSEFGPQVAHSDPEAQFEDETYNRDKAAAHQLDDTQTHRATNNISPSQGADMSATRDLGGAVAAPLTSSAASNAASDRVQKLREELHRLRNEDVEFGLSLDGDEGPAHMA